jgi:ribosomal protein S3
VIGKSGVEVDAAQGRPCDDAQERHININEIKRPELDASSSPVDRRAAPNRVSFRAR